ncbi:MAG: glutamine synthetase family protein [Candidatus Hodarchaeales archaeon]|jgi:glutamine synthetase
MSDIGKAVIQKMDQLGAKYLLLQFTGADGHLKGVEISKRSFSKVDQVGVDGSSIGFLRTKQSDMIIVPDPSTVTLVPWQENTACVFCDLRSTADTHERIAADPRGILAEVCKELYDEFQAIYYARPEMEFYMLNSDCKPADSATYMVLPPKDKGYFLRKMIIETLDQVDIPFKTFHSEVGPGQHEIEFDSLPAIRAADSVQYFKQIAKMVALNQSEWIISFMPKPFISESGNGMHIHQIVKTANEDMFKGSGNELSNFALHFIAGQLNFASEITAITNPIVNSYRRLVPGKEAPVYKTWGIANRTALIRVPGYEAGRLEYRAADAATNIYFTLALLLKSGLEGVRKKLEPPVEANFDADALSLKQLEEKGVELLPRSLKDALIIFKNSQLAKKVLGSALHQEYYDARMNEWLEFTSEHSFEKQEISPWEISHYLDC